MMVVRFRELGVRRIWCVDGRHKLSGCL
jgi:hypothetical protein